MSYFDKCSICKYNISCNYFAPFCDLAEMPIYDEKDCPLNKQKEQTSGEKENDRKWFYKRKLFL